MNPSNTSGPVDKSKEPQPSRVTLADINANIVSEHYFTAHEGVVGACVITGKRYAPYLPALHLLTICVLVLRNGFTVLGQSACVDPADFNAAIGRNVARSDAVDKCWLLMGYALKERQAAPPPPPPDFASLDAFVPHHSKP